MTLGVVRFLLAITVVLYHAGGASQMGGPVPVILFYYLSGIVMFQALSNYVGRFSRIRFLLNRFLRLFPIYFVISLLSLITYQSLSDEYRRFFTFSDLRRVTELVELSNSFWNSLANSSYPVLQWGVQTGNSSLPLPVLSGNSSLVPQGWSIFVEFFFYVFLATKTLKLHPRICNFVTCLFALISAGVYLRAGIESFGFWYQNFFTTAFFFLLGFSIARSKISLNLGEEHRSLLVFVTGLFFLGLLANPIFNFHIQFPLTLFFGLLLCSILFLGRSSFQESQLTKYLGELSYPIYVSHIYVIGLLNVLGAFVSFKFEIEVGVNDARRVVGDPFSYVVVIFTIVISSLLLFIVDNPLKNLRAIFRH